MNRLKFEVHHGAGYEVAGGFTNSAGKVFLLVEHTTGYKKESLLVELTGETISRRDSDGSSRTIYRAFERPLKQKDLEYLDGLAEGMENYVVAKVGIMKVLGMRFTKMTSDDVTRTIRNRIFALT